MVLAYWAPSTVLMVRDDEGVSDGLADRLPQEGFRVVVVRSEEEALDLLRVSQPAPAVILLHVGSENGDAWTFRKEQLGDPRLKDVPVLVTGAPQIAPHAAVALQATGHLPAPIAFDDLLTAVARYGAHC